LLAKLFEVVVLLFELAQFGQGDVVHLEPAQHLAEVAELVLLAILHLNTE
jgi:hypothetical protein